MAWISVEDRQPPAGGEYRVKRRGLGHRPDYEDTCRWSAPVNASRGYWINSRSTIISTVLAWWEDEDGDPANVEGFLIKGPVPSAAIGTCPWCKAEDTVLHLKAMMLDGQLAGVYVCAKCLVNLDGIRDEHRKKGVDVLADQPKVEITEVGGDG